MTTEFFSLPETADVGTAIEALKSFEGSFETIHSVYLTTADRMLSGVVPLARLLVESSNTPLLKLADDPAISVPSHADEKQVINIFHKYNLLTLPVVDDKKRILGMVTADDVLELVIKEK